MVLITRLVEEAHGKPTKTLALGSWYTRKHSIPDLRLTKERCRSKKGKAEHILKP